MTCVKVRERAPDLLLQSTDQARHYRNGSAHHVILSLCYHTPDSPTGIVDVAHSPRDQMNVNVENCLSCRLAGICADIKAVDARV